MKDMAQYQGEAREIEKDLRKIWILTIVLVLLSIGLMVLAGLVIEANCALTAFQY